jgi:hypothetical protein
MPWGLALHNLKVPAVPVVLYGCGVVPYNPQVLLLEVATALSCLSLVVMPFSRFSRGMFGKSPEYYYNGKLFLCRQ